MWSGLPILPKSPSFVHCTVHTAYNLISDSIRIDHVCGVCERSLLLLHLDYNIHFWALQHNLPFAKHPKVLDLFFFLFFPFNGADERRNNYKFGEAADEFSLECERVCAYVCVYVLMDPIE